MAGDWIKVEKCTARKPEVLRLAELLSIHPDHAFGLCVRFWFWCDDQLDSCHAQNVTNVTLDYTVGHTGFATALVEVGWLRARNGSLEVPNFDRHLSDSAKKRADSLRRKQKQRSSGVTEMSHKKRDKSVTREREEIEKSNTPSHTPATPIETHLNNPEFANVWDMWGRHLLDKDKPLTPTTSEAQLYDLARFSVDEAMEVVRFSINRGAKNLITNGDHRQESRRQGGGNFRRKTPGLEGLI